jgi:hypothetical protein
MADSSAKHLKCIFIVPILDVNYSRAQLTSYLSAKEYG